MGKESKDLLAKARETIQKTEIPGLFVVERPTFPDERGLFREIFRENELKVVTGVEFFPCQANHSVSHPNVIRAIHAEGWNKLVYPVTGVMFAAIVDLRPDSPTFTRVEEFTFDTSKGFKALFIPKGLGNSICVMGDQDVHYVYMVDDYYNGDVRAVAWDDPDLNISWPVPAEKRIISERDKNNPTLRQLFGGTRILVNFTEGRMI